MNIRQTSLALAVALFLSFVAVISFKLYGLYEDKNSLLSAQSSIEASSQLNKAIIELSFERSVMQVTLSLDDPIAPEFKKILDTQRQKSDENFKIVAKMVGDGQSFRRGDEFLKALKNLQNQIEKIRQIADDNLMLPFAQREKEQVSNLPLEMKDAILSFSKLPILIRPEGLNLPTVVSTLERIQHSAWAIREYGGRERTYLAIATATGRKLDQASLKDMRKYHDEALEAMSGLDFYSQYSGLDNKVVDEIKAVREAYFVSYDKLRKSIIDASENDVPYPVTFSDFFAKSSAALDKAVNLSYLAGDTMVEHMQRQGQNAVMLFWVFSGVLAFVLIVCGFQIYYTQFRVSGRILELADRMRILTEGKTDINLQSLRANDEIGQMAKHVEVFRDNAIEVRRLGIEQAEQQKKPMKPRSNWIRPGPKQK